MIIRLVLRFGQPCARDIELDVPQLGRSFAVRHPGKPRDQRILGRAQNLKRKRPGTVLGFERAIVRQRHRVLDERAKPHLAANAVRGSDLSNAHPGRASLPPPYRTLTILSRKGKGSEA